MSNDHPNVQLRARREALPSPSGSGEPMSCAELARAVNAYLAPRRRSGVLDGDTVARYERGATHWPRADRREALRAVLGADTDADLGFYNSWRAGRRSDPDNITGRYTIPGDARLPQEDVEGLAVVVPMPGAFHGDVPEVRQVVGNLVITISSAPQAGEASGQRQFQAGRTNPAGAVAGADTDSSLVTIRVEVLVQNLSESGEL